MSEVWQHLMEKRVLDTVVREEIEPHLAAAGKKQWPR